jgi:hypothetical protein
MKIYLFYISHTVIALIISTQVNYRIGNPFLLFYFIFSLVIYLLAKKFGIKIDNGFRNYLIFITLYSLINFILKTY